MQHRFCAAVLGLLLGSTSARGEQGLLPQSLPALGQRLHILLPLSAELFHKNDEVEVLETIHRLVTSPRFVHQLNYRLTPLSRRVLTSRRPINNFEFSIQGDKPVLKSFVNAFFSELYKQIRNLERKRLRENNIDWEVGTQLQVRLQILEFELLRTLDKPQTSECSTFAGPKQAV